MTNIVTASPDFPGVMRVFSELSKLGLSKHVNLSEKNLHLQPDDVLILGGWIPEYLDLLKQIPNRKGVLWTSTVYQSEMSVVELEYVNQLRRLLDGMIDFIWFGDRDWLTIFQDDRCFYAPYPLTLHKPMQKNDLDKEFKHISLFCPCHPRKNILNQVLAVKRVSTETNVVLHTNNIQEPYLTFIKDAGLNHVDHGWMQHNEYYGKVACMDCGLQVSCDGVESLNYVVLDFLQQGTPIVFSKSIYDNMRVESDTIRFTMVVNDFSSQKEIATRINYVLGYDKHLSEKCIGFAKRFSEDSNKLVMKTFKEFFKLK